MIVNDIRPIMKQQMPGHPDTWENLYTFFLNRVRDNLHIVLCFSPVGDKFRIRARQFPALVNCTMFDSFHGWPNEALVNVAQRFLTDVPNVEVRAVCRVCSCACIMCGPWPT